ncbi:alpha/beta fold hydrolase [Paraburkholderia sp.]|uniref:thioesterase II family protein n=1 Tax=Paraburkholderia sp. TaxID=1926495 RepID=UPI002393780D|nr:alpha/beta fold hydrolase [Paraburkholderia sp.]MDE1182646.1 alpha/beta fold hydrolase [Paraburkholderia sp.]
MPQRMPAARRPDVSADSRALREASPVTLFCLPYAGGHSMTYRGWRDLLPSWIECVPLDLPGHGRLRAMSPLSDWPALIDALIDAIGPLPAQDVAIFGHSMGALVGLELAHALRERTGRTPAWLGVSACVAPLRRDYETKWLDCSVGEMVDELRRLGGTPEALLEDEEFLDLALPVLRADFHLCATYVRRAHDVRKPLDCPVAVFGGRDDTVSEQSENLSAWCHETIAQFSEHTLDGGHFFVETARRQLTRDIATALRDVPGVANRSPAIVAAGCA